MTHAIFRSCFGPLFFCALACHALACAEEGPTFHHLGNTSPHDGRQLQLKDEKEWEQPERGAKEIDDLDDEAVAAVIMPFMLLASGSYSPGQAGEVILLPTAEAATAFWGSSAPPAAWEDAFDAIDWQQEMLIAVTDEVRPTGGFAYELGGLVRIGGRLVVQTSTRAPDCDAVVTQALTTPFAVAKLSRFEPDVMQVQATFQASNCQTDLVVPPAS